MTTSYEGLLALVLATGELRTDRTGTGTLSLFAPDPLHYSLRDNRVPLITSKHTAWRMATAEFMWMLSGSTQISELTNPGMRAIWANWADEDGELGPTYGAQYRRSGSFSDEFNQKDQLRDTIDLLLDNPDTRRAIISLWSVQELEYMGLEPCMVLFQFSLRGPEMNKLHVHVYQRSADLFLGVPFDLYQAGLLAHLVARELSIESDRVIRATDLTWSVGDAHIYLNQVDAVQQVLANVDTMPPMTSKLEIVAPRSFGIKNRRLAPGHINVTDYRANPSVSAPLAV